MEYSYLIQEPDGEEEDTFKGVLKSWSAESHYDRIYAAMAYVSVAGVREILDDVMEGRSTHSKWVIGLDDAITQPGETLKFWSISYLRLVAGGESAKVAALRRRSTWSLYFHRPANGPSSRSSQEPLKRSSMIMSSA